MSFRWTRTRLPTKLRSTGDQRHCLDLTNAAKRGGLYIFDRQSLETLLQSSSSILSANRWPLDPDQFVARIAREWIDQAHPVASVIRRAFGDQAI
jgi:hypothetical protein